VNEAPNLIQQLLKALAEHSDLVSEAIRGPVSTGGKRNKGVDTLIRMRALMPVDEDTYYLNPLLREFIGDFVVSYGAFRQLAQLDMPIRQLRLEFDNLREFRREGSVRDADRAMDRLDEAVVRIGFFMDQNLQVLGAKVTTNFGDVDSVAGKIRENKFYIEEVRRFSRQIVSLNAKVQEMEREAIGLQLPEVRRLLNVRILSRLTDWTARIGDIQRVVSKNLFALRQIEQRQRNLANVALWLSKNRMSDGFELDVTAEAAERLATPAGLVTTWNVDVADNDMAVTQGVLAAAKRLPPIAITSKPAPIASPEVLTTTQAVVEPEVEPIDELIDAYVEHIRHLDHHADGRPVSMLQWRERFGEVYGLEQTVTDEEWLLYACAQIASAGLPVEVVARPRAPGEYNDIFTDARARQQNSQSAALNS
jgi:hypothetical protein